MLESTIMSKPGIYYYNNYYYYKFIPLYKNWFVYNLLVIIKKNMESTVRSQHKPFSENH